MNRRRFIGMGLGLAALAAGSGHTPYRQWKVYRQKHLLIGACKADAPTYDLAQRIVETLARQLPESSPRASRAPNQHRLASLLSSDQMQVIILRRREAVALTRGGDPFEAVGAVPLNRLFTMGEHVLICRPDFPDHHGWLLAEALSQHGGAIPGGVPADPATGPIPVHPGALAYAQGRPLPEAPVPVEAKDPDHGHAH